MTSAIRNLFSSPVDVVGRTAIVEITPVLTVHANYATGDYVGTSEAAAEFANAVASAGGGGRIETAVLIDYALQKKATELWLFDTAITPPADSAAWTISDAHSKTCLGVITFAAANYKDSAANTLCTVETAIRFKALAGLTSIYGCLVTRDTPAYASGDVTVRLAIVQD